MNLKTIHINSVCLFFLLFSLTPFPINNADIFYLTYVLALLILVVAVINIYFVFNCLCQSYLNFKPIILSSSKKQTFRTAGSRGNKKKGYQPVTLIPALCFQLIFVSFVGDFIFSYELFDKFFLFFGLMISLFYFLLYFVLKRLFPNSKNNLILVKKYKKTGKIGKVAGKIGKVVYLYYLFKLIFALSVQSIFDLGIVGITKISLLLLLIVLTVTNFIFGFIYALCDLDGKWHYSKISYRWLWLFLVYYAVIGGFLIIFHLQFNDFFIANADSDFIRTFFVLDVNWYDLVLIICSIFFFPLGVNVSYLLLRKRQTNFNKRFYSHSV